MTVTVSKEEEALRESLGLTDVDEGYNWINALFYGDVGAGKTHLTGTAADILDTSPMLIFDVEGGLKTLSKFENKSRMKRVPIRTMKELTDKYNTLYKSIQIDPATKIPFIPGINTVGLDSLSELTDLDMRSIMKEAYEKNPDKVDQDVPSQREWGKARAHIRTIVRAFRDLPCNIIMTAQVGSLQEEGQPTKFFPGFAGKLRTEVPGFFDIVGYLYAENTGGAIERKVQFTGTRRIVAKDRTGKLGDVLINPTIPDMWQLING